jgi:manganese/iron transport system substrate-binding protein
MSPKKLPIFILVVIMLVAFTACSGVATTPASTGEKLNVVATTTLVGDVVRQIGGSAIQVTVLLPVGMDPHSFEPTPQDAALLSKADLIFANGAGLEEFLDPLLKSAAGDATVVHVSDGIQLMASTEEHEATEEQESAEEHAHEGGDPHVWMDPNNVQVWVNNIQQALAKQDPANASLYQTNADAYHKQLTELDAWVRQQVNQVSQANRQLVTDHKALGYFAARYGFEQVGAVIPSFTSLAEPSAQELATLEDAIQKLGVKAVFVGSSVNPTLAQRVADDTHIKLVTFYTGSLSAADGPAGTYLDYIRYNVGVIVEALK